MYWSGYLLSDLYLMLKAFSVRLPDLAKAANRDLKLLRSETKTKS